MNKNTNKINKTNKIQKYAQLKIEWKWKMSEQIKSNRLKFRLREQSEHVNKNPRANENNNDITERGGRVYWMSEEWGKAEVMVGDYLNLQLRMQRQMVGGESSIYKYSKHSGWKEICSGVCFYDGDNTFESVTFRGHLKIDLFRI